MPKTEVGQFGMQVSALRLGNGALLRWYVRERHLDPNAKDEGKSVLHVAVAENRFDMVVALLALGADPNIQDRQGRSPLHLASHYAYDQIQRALLAAGARTDLRDYERQTPLHLVAGFDLEWGVRAIELKKGRHACARALLKAGASPHALNRAGQSSRAMALDKGRDDLVELFDLYEGVTPRR